MKLPGAANDNRLLQIVRTKRVWRDRIGYDLTDEAAREITYNVAGFFRILKEWSDAERHVATNDLSHPPARTDAGDEQ